MMARNEISIHRYVANHTDLHRAAAAWMPRAACADLPTQMFYPIGRRGAASFADNAKLVCSVCSVRTKCLELALEADEVDGIWGGLDEFERAKLRRKRRSYDEH